MKLSVKVNKKQKKRESLSAANLTPSLLTAGARKASLSHTPLDDVIGHKNPYSRAKHRPATPTLDGMRLPSMHHQGSNQHIAYTPKPQLVLLWSNIALFLICILIAVLAIVGVLGDSIMVTSVILIVVSTAGLILSIFYRSNLLSLKALRDKVIQHVRKVDGTLLEGDEEEYSDMDEPALNRSPRHRSLLARFRTGDFHKVLATCSSDDLKGLLPIVAQSLCQLPFGFTEFRSQLLVQLAERISQDVSLDQAMRFFLNCNRDIPEVARIWEDHEYLNSEMDMIDDVPTMGPNNLVVSASPPRSKSAHGQENGLNGFSVGINTYSATITRGGSNAVPTEDVEAKDDEPSVDDAEELDVPQRNAVMFFRSLFTELVKEGDIQPVEDGDYFCDPVTGKMLREVMLKKVMPSNARPLLVEARCVDEAEDTETLYSTQLLLKQGDDLRKDLAVMLMFKFMNELWRENDVNCNGVPCESLCYDVVPMAVDFGAIEFIDGAKKISKISKMINQKDASGRVRSIANKIIATAAASYIASYVLGVRDRHHDNILVREDGAVFHIDFAYILGETIVGLDAALIAISPNFKKALGNLNWNVFLDVSVLCYSILRANYVQLLDYARVAFAFMRRAEDNELYLKQSLMLDLTDHEASDKIRTMFTKAPGKWSTKAKNVVHKFAVKGIKRKTRTQHAASGSSSKEMLASPREATHLSHHSRTMSGPRTRAPSPHARD